MKIVNLEEGLWNSQFSAIAQSAVFMSSSVEQHMSRSNMHTDSEPLGIQSPKSEFQATWCESSPSSKYANHNLTYSFVHMAGACFIRIVEPVSEHCGYAEIILYGINRK